MTLDELLLFVDVGGRRFALRGRDVVEIHRMVLVSPLPEAPAVVEGVIEIRGEVVPVLDLRHRLGVEPDPLAIEDRLVVVSSGGREVALHVGHHVETASATVEDVDRTSLPDLQYAAGLVRRSDGVVVVHAVEAFLSAEELSALDDALAGRQP